MPPVKQCPECGTKVAIRKSVCVCGHSFKTKRPVYSTRKSKRIAMKQQRASESADDVALRLVKDSTRKAQKRALETSDESWCRQEQDRACKAKRRGSETAVETAQRREKNRACMAKKRESETVVETIQRQKQNRTCMAERRAVVIPMEKCITDFKSKVKQGPEFVCICCHRLMYKQTVVLCTKSKYTKASNELLEQVFSAEHNYITSDGKQWICKTCDGTLKKGNMPLQAKANGLQLCTIPNQLSGLNYD